MSQPETREPQTLAPSQDEIWSAFVAGPRTLGPTPGARESWRRGRERYAVWMLRVQDRVVLERMAEIATALDSFVEPVPTSLAHVTVYVAGFPTPSPLLDDDVATSVLAAQRAALIGAGPVDLEIGRGNAFLSAPILEVCDPAGAIPRLRARLAACLRPGDRGEVRFESFVPHVTVGTFRESFPTTLVATALAPYRGLDVVRVRTSPPQLVEIDAVRPNRWASLA